jgi:hypothetical protein
MHEFRLELVALGIVALQTHLLRVCREQMRRNVSVCRMTRSAVVPERLVHHRTDQLIRDIVAITAKFACRRSEERELARAVGSVAVQAHSFRHRRVWLVDIGRIDVVAERA